MAVYPTSTTLQGSSVTGTNVAEKLVNEVARIYRVNWNDSSVTTKNLTDQINCIPVYAGEAVRYCQANVLIVATGGNYSVGLQASGANLIATASATATGVTVATGAGLNTYQTADTFITCTAGPTTTITTAAATPGIIEIFAIVTEVYPQ